MTSTCLLPFGLGQTDATPASYTLDHVMTTLQDSLHKYSDGFVNPVNVMGL